MMIAPSHRILATTKKCLLSGAKETLRPPNPYPYLLMIFVEQRIAYSNNSRLGLDSIPNAFYRTHPILFAMILAWGVEYWECNDDIGDPLPHLLTWIGKAIAGLYDNCWRTLSVPTTYNRLLAGGVTNWVTVGTTLHIRTNHCSERWGRLTPTTDRPKVFSTTKVSKIQGSMKTTLSCLSCSQT